MQYNFTNKDKKIVERIDDSNNSMFIPWDSVNNTPRDTEGEIYRLWISDGSIAPTEIGITSDEVNFERDRRAALPITADAYQREDNGNYRLVENAIFDFDEKAKRNVSGAVTLAIVYLNSVIPGDVTWGGLYPDGFTWIASDNGFLYFDPIKLVEFGQRGAHVVSSLTISARNLKNMDTIPSDYTDDSYWVID